MNVKPLYTFLRELAANNNREWFAAHRDRYEEVRDIVSTLTSQLLLLTGSVNSEALRLTPAQCTYRINRDTRFSTDKSPYKTHIGIFINPPLGKKALTGGYYFHLEPGASAIYCGTYGLPAPIIKRIREDIYHNVEEYRAIVEDPEFRRYFPAVGFDCLKTAPKGYDKEWPYMEYIRPRQYGAECGVDDDFFSAPDLESKLLPMLRQMRRYNDFINLSIDSFGQKYHESR